MCSPRFNFWYSICGVIIGVTAAVPFALQFHLVNATLFCLISSLFAALAACLHWRAMKGMLNERKYIGQLRLWMLIGCIGQLIGACALVAYISVAAALGQGITGDWLYKVDNYWIASVWGWMTLKWAFSLFVHARRYRRRLLYSLPVVDMQRSAEKGDEYEPLISK